MRRPLTRHSLSLRSTLFLTFLILVAGAARAGTLKGIVKDSDSGDELIGVDIVLVGYNIKASTDIEGRFEISDLDAGTYEMRLTYLGYNAKFLADLVVKASGTLEVEIIMESFQAHAGGEMVVTANRVLSTESAILANRKQSAIIGDAISAAQISRSPDGTSGEALNRVTGLMVNDGRYLMIRGMPDRYSATTLNGIPVTSTDVYRDIKSFNFDLIPSNLLSSLVVLKSVTPGMPAEVTSGLVEVKTLEYPEQSTTKIGVSAGYVDNSTGKEVLQDAMAGSDDWWGIDDGGRDLPEFDTPRTDIENRNQVAKTLPNRWDVEGKNAAPKFSFNASHGNKKHILGGKLGYQGALSFKNKMNVNPEGATREPIPDVGGEESFSDALQHKYEVLWGGLGNLYFSFDENHRLGLTNVYTRSAENTVTEAEGEDADSRNKWRRLNWEERYLYASRLDGTHDLDFLTNGLDLSWGLYYGENSATQPDSRFVEYIVDDGDEDEIIERMNANLRSWTWLEEYRRGWNVDLKYSFADHPDDEAHSLKLKAGISKQRRSRDFDTEAWVTSPTFMPSSRALAYLPMDEIFAPENYNDVYDLRRGQAFNFVLEDRFSGVYEAGHELNSTYVMADLPFTLFQEDLRIVGGVRMEDSDLYNYTIANPAAATVDSARIDEKDYFPSVNLTWKYDENFNIRMAYYESINRPEFRELSPVLRRDFVNYRWERGNPELKPAMVKNYDVRAEFFPGYGEVLAASFFYKDLKNAIEDSLTPTPEGDMRSFTNAPEGRNYGFELEGRMKLDFWSVTEDFTFSINYTRIWSEVEAVDPAKETYLRPMQGQAPWMINMYLMYDNPNTKTSINVLYNNIGQRLYSAATNEAYGVYENPYQHLDVVAVQKFWKRYQVKFAAKDILGGNRERVYGLPVAELPYSTSGKSSEYSISFSARF
jgi:outer membrane receptor protein involved in Fe transport